MPRLSRADGIFVLDLGDNENRFSPDWLDAFDAALTEVEASEAPSALVTVGSGKFYTNGLDLDWVTAHMDQWDTYAVRVEGVLSRMLKLPVPTVAAVNGHAFGAGAMLAMTHDYRVMREDRGFFCFPEVDINIPFTKGMAALIQAKLTPQTAVRAMTTGRRYGGAEAVTVGLVDSAASQENVLPAAVALVDEIAAKAAPILSTIRTTMYAEVIAALEGR